MTWVELQSALYAAYKVFDGKNKKAGKKMVRDIYKEYQRRGFKKIVTPEL